VFSFSFAFTCFAPILQELPVTLILTIGSVFFALIGGILLSLGISCKLRAVSTVFSVISSFLKGIPILVFLYLFNNSIDDVMKALSRLFNTAYDIRNPPNFLFAILAMALSYTPYMSDMILSALETVPKGQSEACESLGFTKLQTMKRIVLPQMMVIALPNFGNHFVNLLKATSLTYMVTILEMMGAAKNYAVLNQKFLEPYVVCSLIYWAIFLVFEKFFRILEKITGRYLQPSAIRQVKKSEAAGLIRRIVPSRRKMEEVVRHAEEAK
jgi:L-cystine transport system permease protein